MSNLWWHTHRQLQRGSRGDDVAKAQKALNSFSVVSPDLVPDGDFGQKTHDAVVAFQRMFDLEPDGILGPVAQTKLLGGSYRFELAQPDLVFQGTQFLCWASCLQSVLGRDWSGRPRRTKEQLVAEYPDDVTQDGPETGGISVAAFRSRVGTDYRFREVLVAADHTIEQVFRALRKRVPLLLVTMDAPGGVFHACVVYGAKVTVSSSALMLMDPLGMYRTEEMFTVNAHHRTGFFLPDEVTL